MLASLVAQEPGPLRVHFLCDEAMPPSAIDSLSGLVADEDCELIVHRIDPRRLRGVERFGRAPKWFRFLLPELCPETERVLYLDADIVVTDGLRALWETELSAHALGAVRTVFPFPEWGARHCAALGLPDPAMYFNAGVLLMNLQVLRARGFPAEPLDQALAHVDRHDFQTLGEDTDEALEYIAAHPERAVFGDQDTLNALLWDSWLALHPRWNCMNQVVHSPLSGAVYGERERDEAIHDPAVRHFEGGSLPRPWQEGAAPEERELYWSYRSRTPWADPS
jgi:lipopolysaccharide biosynthesis glycosyltransferase